MIAPPPSEVANRATRRRQLEQLIESELGSAANGRQSFQVDIARCRRLRLCLERMGPVFAAFGRYLSSRVDFVPEPLGEELAEIADVGRPSTPSEVREVFVRELQCPPEGVFTQFDAEPFESRVSWQVHHARLGNAEVVVRVIHPDFGRELDDSDLLELLERPLVDCGFSTQGISGVIADFLRVAVVAGTFEASIEAGKLFTQDAQAFELLGALHLYTHLCTRHLAVYEGWHSLDTSSAPDLARTLCTIWLKQSLQGSVYPVEATRENTRLTPQGRIAFPCGEFATLPDALKTSVWNYLIAVAAGNADEIVAQLAAAMQYRPHEDAYNDLQRRIRQMVPFRDGFRRAHGASCWPVNGLRIAEDMLIHWRIANENGHMSEALISFFRGLFNVARTAQSLAPGRDSLAEAVWDLRLLTTASQIKDVMRPSQMAELIENYATAWVGLAERIDRLLDYAEGGLSPSKAGKDVEKQEKAENRYLQTVCLLVAFAAIGLWLHRISGLLSSSSSAVVALSFLALGIYVLRAGMR